MRFWLSTFLFITLSTIAFSQEVVDVSYDLYISDETEDVITLSLHCKRRYRLEGYDYSYTCRGAHSGRVPNNSLQIEGPNIISYNYSPNIFPWGSGSGNPGYFASPETLFIRIKPPTSDVTFTVSWYVTDNYKNYDDCSADTKTTGYIASITIPSKVVTITHFLQSKTNPLFSGRTLVNNIKEIPAKVCADGTTSSLFKFSGGSATGKYTYVDVTISGASSQYLGTVRKSFSYPDSLLVEYTHPANIPINETFLALTIYLTEPGTGNVLASKEIRVYRAPVAMVHGLWSNQEAFVTMENSLVESGYYSRNLLKRVDYSSSNNSRFITNGSIVPNAIRDHIIDLANQGIVAGSVDVVGHSMGGILTRLYLQSTYYHKDIHKFITLNTPHSGSQIANLLLDNTNQYSNQLACSTLASLFLSNNVLCSEGAVEDLAVNSYAILYDLNGTSINRNKVPSHTVVTAEYASPNEAYETFTLKDKTFGLKLFFDGSIQTGLKSIFSPELDNDLIVAASSQKGGLTGSQTSFFEDQIHMGSPANNQVIAKVKDLLLATPTSVSFCQTGFTPIRLTYNRPSQQARPLVKLASVDAGIHISSPLNEAQYEPGSTIPITINGVGITEIRALISYNQDSIYVAKKEALSFDAQVPVGTYRGKRTMIVYGKTTDGGYVVDSKTFYVSTATAACSSILSGEWLNSSTWSCGRVPAITDTVIINPGHIVTVSTLTAQAQQIIFNGGVINYEGPSSILLKSYD